MSEPAPDWTQLFSRATVEREAVLEAFEAEWASGRRPRIEDFLPAHASDSRLLAELARTDVIYRLRAGDAARAEEYLARFAGLASNHVAAVELIVAEYQLTSLTDGGASASDFLDRYPQYAAALALRLGEHGSKDTPNLEAAMATPALEGESAASTLPPLTPAPHRFQVSAERGTASDVRYRPTRLHAKGGIGEVHLAQDSELGREVALKRIQGHLADHPDYRRRFLLEAEITARLQHPGIVPIYGLVEDAEGQPCYAMRFIEGHSLKEAIERFHGKQGKGDREQEERSQETGDRSRKAAQRCSPRERGSSECASRSVGPTDREKSTPLEFRKLLDHFVDACNAIEYAHSRGVIHRDIKPANIMLGAYGETLVVDWGLAKMLRREGGMSSLLNEPNKTASSGSPPDEIAAGASADAAAGSQMGDVMGTPAYMSPEQAKGRLDALGPPADIYSLGATLYSLLTGLPAFRGADQLAQVSEGVFPPPRQGNRNVPRALNAICLKAMALRPEDRYASARALADDVEHWLADEPVAAMRESLAQRAARWTRRHRGLTRAAMGAGALVVVAVVVAYSREAHLRVVLSQALTKETVALEAETVAKNAEAAAKNEAFSQRTLADNRFQLARAAVDELFTEVSQDRTFLRNEPGMQELRRRLLEKAKTYYERFSEEKSDDPDIRRATASSYERLAEIVRVLEPGEKVLAVLKHAQGMRKGLAEEPAATIEDQFEAARTTHNTGIALADLGRREEALVALAEAQRRFEASYQREPERKNFVEGLAGVHEEVGELLAQGGDVAGGLAAMGEAQTLLEKLVQDDPDKQRYALDLLRLYFNSGTAHTRLGQLAESLAVLTKAQTLGERLFALDARDAEVGSLLGKVYNNMSRAASLLGDQPRALGLLDRARGVKEQLVRDNPAVPSYAVELAVTLGTLGEWSDDPERGRNLYRQAIEILEPLVEKHGHLVENLGESLARAYYGRGFVDLKEKRHADSLDWFTKSLTSAEQVLDVDPERTEARFLRVSACWMRADQLQALGRYREALEDWERLVEISPKMRDEFRARRAYALAFVGEYAEATAEAAALARNEKLSGQAVYTLGCGLSLAAGAANDDGKLAEQFAERSVAMLRRAKSAGFFDNAANVEHLDEDSDLDAIRDREDFRQFVAGLHGEHETPDTQ